MLYTSQVSCEILLFDNANWIFFANHRSINMSLASLLQMQILSRFFDATLLPVKSTRFWHLKGSFSTPEPSLSWSVMIAKTLGVRIPLVLVRGPLFRWAKRSWPASIFRHVGRKICFYTAKIKRAVPYTIGLRAKILESRSQSECRVNALFSA